MGMDPACGKLVFLNGPIAISFQSRYDRCVKIKGSTAPKVSGIALMLLARCFSFLPTAEMNGRNTNAGFLRLKRQGRVWSHKGLENMVAVLTAQKMMS